MECTRLVATAVVIRGVDAVGVGTPASSRGPHAGPVGDDDPATRSVAVPTPRAWTAPPEASVTAANRAW
jgi:hypothetical protein